MALKKKTDAIKALEEISRLDAEVKELMQKHGINDRLAEISTLKKDVVSFAVAKNISVFPIRDGLYARLIQAVSERLWIGTRADMPNDAPSDARPLRSLVSKEVWMKITSRVPDPVKIDSAVGEGLVELDEIAPAYMERLRAPYVRIFEGSHGEDDT